ncbi:MAG: glycosyltransferase [Planctomycetota bacterium]
MSSNTSPSDPARPAPLRVLHVFPSFEVGGVQRRVVRLVELLGQEFEHAVLSLSGNFEAGALLADPTAVEQVPAPPKAGSLSTMRALRGLIVERRPDLLLTYNWGSIDAALATRLGGPAHVHHEDGFGADEANALKRRRGVLRRLALGRAHTTVVPSKNLERIATGTWRLPRVTWIPNGVDLERFKPGDGDAALRAEHGLPAEARVLLSVGALRAEKRIDRLIEVFEGVAPERDLWLWIVGDGPLAADLRARAAASPAAERIRFAGAQSDTAPFFRAADLFALSSDTEQMPLALVEAMAAGRPCLSTDVGDVATILPEEQAGGRVPLAPPESLTKRLRAALEGLLDDGERRAAWGRANRARVEELYAQEVMVERYRALYREAVAAARPLHNG